jgi:hypothetical protein
METIIKSLNNIGIVDPERIKAIALLIANSASDSFIHNAAEVLSSLSEIEIEKIRQQVLGGQ